MLTWQGLWPSARARVSHHPAFGGVFEISASGAHLQAAWTNGDQTARLISRLDSGQPIGQPVALGGPFVMNTKTEITEAFNDFHSGKFGDIPAGPPEVPLTGAVPTR